MKVTESTGMMCYVAVGVGVLCAKLRWKEVTVSYQSGRSATASAQLLKVVN